MPEGTETSKPAQASPDLVPQAVESGGKDVRSLEGSPEGRGHYGKVGIFASLSLRDFRILWFGTALSSAGQWLQQLTLNWVVYDLTGSGTLLGGINAMRAVAMISVGPFGGVVVDRVNRQMLMLATKLFLTVTSLTFGLLLTFNVVETWHFFAFMLLFGMAQVFDQPLRQTVMFDLVPRRFVPNAIALMTGAFNVTRALGPGIGGFLIVWFGPESNFFLQAVAYILVAISVLMIRFPIRTAIPGKASVVKNLGEGLAFVVKQPTTRTFVLISFIAPLLVIPIFNALSPIYAKDVFKGGPSALGYLISSAGVGGVFGAVFTASLTRFERRGVLLLISLFGICGGLFVFSYSPNVWVGMPFMGLAAFAEMIFLTTNQTLLQLSVPNELRGRVTSLLMLGMALMPLGVMFAGVGSDLIGPQTITRIMVGLAAAIGILVAIFVPMVRNLKLSQSLATPEATRRHGS